MTEKDAISQLKNEYPGKTIIKIPEDNPTEIICEIEPTKRHSDYSKAIAAIKSSAPHYHLKAVEDYKVISGTLNLFVDYKQIVLQVGDSHTIMPNQVHSATGEFALVCVTSKPGWTPEDHILST